MLSKTVFFPVILSITLAFGSACASFSEKDVSGVTHPDSASTCVKQELARACCSWDGGQLPAYPQGQPEVTILRISIPPGTRLENHYHPVINAGVVISGELTVVSKDGKVLYLKPGDPIVELVNTIHYGINQGTETVDLIVFYAGISGKPITVPETKK